MISNDAFHSSTHTKMLVCKLKLKIGCCFLFCFFFVFLFTNKSCLCCSGWCAHLARVEYCHIIVLHVLLLAVKIVYITVLCILLLNSHLCISADFLVRWLWSINLCSGWFLLICVPICVKTTTSIASHNIIKMCVPRVRIRKGGF